MVTGDWKVLPLMGSNTMLAWGAFRSWSKRVSALPPSRRICGTVPEASPASTCQSQMEAVHVAFSEMVGTWLASSWYCQSKPYTAAWSAWVPRLKVGPCTSTLPVTPRDPVMV